jgi:methylmalonyl-CoA mutase cobalamin-binding domain/chain
MLEDLRKSIVDLEEQRLNELLKTYLNNGVDPNEIVGALRDGLEEIGKKFERGEYFLSELIMAGEIMKGAMNLLEPHFKGGASASRGKIVLGTIIGDLHDIGKNIIKMLLASAGFEVYDLGIDVPPREFVEAAKRVRADILGISTLLSVTVPKTAEVVKLLEESGLRKKVKVIIGGAVVRKEHEKMFGVDAAVNDAVKGLKVIKSWTGSSHET